MSQQVQRTIEQNAQLLAFTLEKSRKEGRTSPTNPIKGREIAQYWNKKFKTAYSDVDVRQWVNCARSMGYPIWSNRRGKHVGYAWCVNEAEWKETVTHIMSSIQSQLNAISKVNKHWEHINQKGIFTDDRTGNGHGNNNGHGDVPITADVHQDQSGKGSDARLQPHPWAPDPGA